MNEEEKKAVERFKRLYLKDFNNEKITNEDRLSYIECALISNLIEKIQKENEEIKLYNNSITSEIEQMTTEKFKNGWFHQSEFKGLIPVQKVKDKIEEIQKEYNKLDEQIDEYINDVNKDLSKYYENKERIGKMQMLSYFIDNLQELIEEREEK